MPKNNALKKLDLSIIALEHNFYFTKTWQMVAWENWKIIEVVSQIKKSIFLVFENC